MRAWERFYSENVTETDLDAILAYYRSPAGQKDVSASRAALGQVQRYMHEKHAPTAQLYQHAQPLAPRRSRPTRAGRRRPARLPQRPHGGRPGTEPRAPDGRVVPSPASPEQCDVPPTPAASGRTRVAGPSSVSAQTRKARSLANPSSPNHPATRELTPAQSRWPASTPAATFHPP